MFPFQISLTLEPARWNDKIDNPRGSHDMTLVLSRMILKTPSKDLDLDRVFLTGNFSWRNVLL